MFWGARLRFPDEWNTTSQASIVDLERWIGYGAFLGQKPREELVFILGFLRKLRVASVQHLWLVGSLALWLLSELEEGASTSSGERRWK